MTTSADAHRVHNGPSDSDGDSDGVPRGRGGGEKEGKGRPLTLHTRAMRDTMVLSKKSNSFPASLKKK